MNTAKIFVNGKSQAVRLPKEYRFDDEEVYVNKIDDIVILVPKKQIWNSFMKSINKFSLDYLKNREQLPLEKR